MHRGCRWRRKLCIETKYKSDGGRVRTVPSVEFLVVSAMIFRQVSVLVTHTHISMLRLIPSGAVELAAFTFPQDNRMVYRRSGQINRRSKLR